MTTTFYRHWRDVPERVWRWPNFSPAEIACRGTGKLLVDEPALDRLQALRDRLGKPLIVCSAYRSPKHNRAVGGARRSKHMDGAAEYRDGPPRFTARTMTPGWPVQQLRRILTPLRQVAAPDRA